MTEYRVGEAGATVFNAEGKPLATLRPGYVVVAGKIDTPGSPADQFESKMRRGRSDKQRRAGRDYEDKQA
jgi:hypothetical protein